MIRTSEEFIGLERKCPEIDCPKNPDLNVMVGGGDGFLGREILLA